MEHESIVSFIEAEVGFSRTEFGAASITFKSTGLHLTVFRAGKKVKNVASNAILYNLNQEDCNELALAVQIESKKNEDRKKIVVSAKDRIKALEDKKKLVKTKKDDENEW